MKSLHVRFPVKTGVGSASQLLGASFAFFPSCAAIVLGLASALLHHPIAGLVAAAAGAVLLIGGRAFASDFFADMPLDGTLGPDGVALEGPTVPWDAIAIADLAVRSGDSVDRCDVVIPCRAGPPLTIPSTLDETKSMLSFVNMLRAKGGLAPLDERTYWDLQYDFDDEERDAKKNAKMPEAPPADAPRVEIVRCGSCGAPLVPSEADRVTCPRCGAETPMPADVSARVRKLKHETRAIRAREAALERFTRQPSARAIRAASLAFGAAVSLAWLAATGFWLALAARGRLHAVSAAELVWFALGSSLAGWAFLRAIVASRASSMLTGFETAASAPTDERHEPGCRSCGAPLAVAEGELVAVCGYCGTSNALVVLVPRASGAVATVRDLAEALRDRAFELQLFVGVAVVVGVPSLVSALYALRAALR